MTESRPIQQVVDKDFYSPWGKFFADTYHKVSTWNPVHIEPEVPPVEDSPAQSSVNAPVQFPDDSVASATPDTFVDQFQKAAELYAAGQFTQAVGCYHAADRLKPGDADCVVMLANCYQAMNQDNKAEAIYKYATDLAPHHAIAWYNRGLVLQRLGRLEEAKECHLNAYRDRFLRGTPTQESVVSSLATVLAKLNDTKSAIRVLTEALEICPTNTPLTNQLMELLADSGDAGGAIDLLCRNEPQDIVQWYANATTTLPLNDRFRQTELLSRVMSVLSLSLVKHPQLQTGFAKAIQAAVKQIKAEGATRFSMLELGGVGLYGMLALRQGCSLVACRVKAWSTLSEAIRKAFRDNGYSDEQVQIQEYVPSTTGAEDPLAELPPDCRLVVQPVNCMATVPLLLHRAAQFRAAGLLTIPCRATFKVVGIQCDQLHQQTNVGPIVSGFDVSNFGDFCTAIRKYNLQIHLIHTPHKVLTEVVSMPIEGDLNQLMRMNVELPVVAQGRLDAIATWYDFELADGVEQSMGPASEGLWKQNIQMVHLDEQVEPGAVVDMELVITKWAKDHAQQWVMFDKIGLRNAEGVGRHDTALGSFDALGGAVWHFDMMSDLKRNDAYERALKAVITPASIVLDIGTGSGLLAMMAARAGAHHVYACEMNADVAEKARKVIQRNGLEDKITVFGLKSTLLQIGAHLPRKADIVVTETMGTDLLSEAMYVSLEDARERLLVPGGIMIPCRGRVLGQLVEMKEASQMDGFAAPKEGELDLRALNRLVPRFWTMAQVQKLHYAPLTNVLALLDFDFNTPMHPKGVLRRLTIPIKTAGHMHAIILWWDALLGRDADGDIVIETGPDSRYASIDHAHWSQMLQVLSLDGVPVAASDNLLLAVYTDNLMTYTELEQC
eukprot:GGOE01006623.1.p1 GENE.GGOE01006623.1~~GGOE01006623.1.p1  ORF type:complete len:912 (-),score=305.71 GGOE01006623.1:210-2891(-)